ncbi:hypothetical protein [Halopelagius longus]|uniref:Uncharacterized protein n=1 Tax=Halopelagius longus TaxID=1236180 RepID=A0A1H1B5C6_9EURY|nr:hypothetical protein [Halopelagius longus]RDI70649.1 hypothetical protein DWB78_02305 [Halopelagius longus]SDQ47093.1 hypothetical protein SAMN05216278_1644 [Halopelagius longus]
MTGADIEFLFESADTEARFVRAYLPEAWERFGTAAHWETGWFWSYRQFAGYDAGPDGGLVRLVFEGDPEALVETESEAWDRFEGLDSWTLTTYDEMGYDSLLEQQRDAKGEAGGEWDYRLKPLVSEFSLAYLREFEEGLPAVGDERDVNPRAFGFWAVIHYAMIQCGYDWYEETAACGKAMRNRLKSVAAYRGADAARQEYDRLLAEFEAYEGELEAYLDANSTGEATVR